MPYKAGDTVLLIGEANFSFALSLARLFMPQMTAEELEMCQEFGLQDEFMKPDIKIIATTLDSKDITFDKYTDAESNVSELTKLDIDCVFEVDGCKLAGGKYKHISTKTRQFDSIVFNFPHVGLGIKDQQRNIEANQKVLKGFFSSVIKSELLKLGTGEIHITVKNGMPYDSWDVKGIAKLCGLTCKTSFTFDAGMYPGYAHRRTLGFQEGLSKSDNEEIKVNGSRTYIFIETVAPTPPQKRKRKSASDDDDDDDDDN